jgi:hypothetical protein
VALRIRKANGMFGSLQKCLFKQKGFSSETKVAVYNSLVLSVLLYGSDRVMGTDSAAIRNKLRGFHRKCVRSMCHVIDNMWHVQEYHITAQALEQRLVRDLPGATEAAVVGACHCTHAFWHRLLRKLLTSWVDSPRMACGQGR